MSAKKKATAKPKELRIPFACPKCGATPQRHGRGDCIQGPGRECEGIICECDEDETPASKLRTHGETISNPCTEANCYHCGWGGKIPKPPKGLELWEQKALKAGWSPPRARAKELARS